MMNFARKFRRIAESPRLLSQVIVRSYPAWDTFAGNASRRQLKLQIALQNGAVVKTPQDFLRLTELTAAEERATYENFHWLITGKIRELRVAPPAPERIQMRTCPGCDRFVVMRPDQRSCSARCRQRISRLNRKNQTQQGAFLYEL